MLWGGVTVDSPLTGPQVKHDVTAADQHMLSTPDHSPQHPRSPSNPEVLVLSLMSRRELHPSLESVTCGNRLGCEFDALQPTPDQRPPLVTDLSREQGKK